MAHVIQYLRKSAHEGTKSVRDGFHSLITPVSSNEDPEPIASPLIGEDGGSGYGTPEEEEAPHHSHRGLGNSNLGLGNSLRALGFTDRYVDWTHSEDSIFRAKVAFAIYLIVAIILYSFILEEWSILDSVYFAVTVFTTVGYGDLSPNTDVSRLCTVVFASSGIIILGVFLGIVGTRLFEIREERTQEKIRVAQQQILEQFSPPQEISEPPAKKSFWDDVWEIAKVEAPIILLLILMASPVVYLEGWDPIMGVYWMFVTGTTIGFGDLRPTHPWSKVICIIYVPLAAAVFGEMLAQIAGSYIERCSDQMEHAFMARALTKADIEKMDLEKDGRVKPYEFLSYMLVTMQKAEQEEIDEILELFRKLDRDQNGYLNQDDLSSKQHLDERLSNVRNSSYMASWD